jgi:hypothetical protein
MRVRIFLWGTVFASVLATYLIDSVLMPGYWSLDVIAVLDIITTSLGVMLFFKEKSWLAITIIIICWVMQVWFSKGWIAIILWRINGFAP